MLHLLLALALAQSEPDLKKVCDVLDLAEKAGKEILDPYLRAGAWRRTAEIRASTRDVEGTLRLLAIIPHDYEKSLAYADVAKALAKAGDEEGARRIVKLGLKAAGEGEQDFKTGNAHAHLLIALAEAGDPETAAKRLGDVGGGPTGKGFAVKEVAFILARKGKLDKALALLKGSRDWDIVRGVQDMVKEADAGVALPLVKLIAEAPLRGTALEAIVQEQFKRGAVDDAVATAGTIEDPSAKAKVLLWLADELRGRKPDAADGLRAQAQGFIKGIQDPYSRCYAWASLAQSWGRAGKPEAAARMAEHAEAARGEIKEEWQRQFMLVSVASAYAAGGKVKKAIELANSDPKAGRDEILAAIAESQVEAGDGKGALLTVEACEEKFHRSVILFEIAKREPKPEDHRKRLAEAAAAMDHVDSKMKSLNDIRNGNPIHEHLYNLLEAQAKAGDFEGSVKLAQRLRRDMGHWFGGFALGRTAKLQAEAGKLDDALRWIDAIDEALPKTLALNGAAEGTFLRSKR